MELGTCFHGRCPDSSASRAQDFQPMQPQLDSKFSPLASHEDHPTSAYARTYARLSPCSKGETHLRLCLGFRASPYSDRRQAVISHLITLQVCALSSDTVLSRSLFRIAWKRALALYASPQKVARVDSDQV